MIRWLLNRFPHDQLTVEGQPYMRRFYLARCRFFQVRVHEILRSDGGRRAHDHPFSFLSVGLRGSYVETIKPHALGPTRWRVYSAPWLLFRRRTDLHRLTVIEGPVWTLIVTGPRDRDARGRARWGFDVDGHWTPWWRYRGGDAYEGTGSGAA